MLHQPRPKDHRAPSTPLLSHLLTGWILLPPLAFLCHSPDKKLLGKHQALRIARAPALAVFSVSVKLGPRVGRNEIWSYRGCLKQGTRLRGQGTCSGLGRRPWCSPEGLLAWRMGRSTPSLGAHDQEHTSKAYFEVLLYYNTTTSHPRDQDQCRTTQNTLSSYLLSSGSARICHLVCIEVTVGHTQIVSQRPPLPACCASTLSKMQKSSTDPAISSFKE